MTALQAALEPKGLTALEPAPAEDKNAFVVTKATADEFSLVKISDLATVTGTSCSAARRSAPSARCASAASSRPTG